MKSSTKKGLALIGGVLGALFLAAGGVALWRADQAKDVLEQITEPASSQREVGVYVLEEDPASATPRPLPWRTPWRKGNVRRWCWRRPTKRACPTPGAMSGP